MVGAIELISPGNKDRDETRRAFAFKAAALLQQGVGLVVVDIATDRHANLHNELMALLNAVQLSALPAAALYTVSYRPARSRESDQIEVWPSVLHLNQTMPVVPLPLDKEIYLPLDLESTYNEACRMSRIS